MSDKYKNGKIYTIRYKNDDSLIYVGSTVQPLFKRWHHTYIYVQAHVHVHVHVPGVCVCVCVCARARAHTHTHYIIYITRVTLIALAVQFVLAARDQ
jgi:hypothetical protein